MLAERLALYRQIERARRRPLIVYVTNSRPNSEGRISADAVAEIQDQLEALPADANSLDLLLVSAGGDPTVAWRIVSLVRERVAKFSVLVPSAAFSAATLLALGADEVIMHANGNLGPTDAQIEGPRPGAQGTQQARFGSEDLGAFIKYAKESVGLTGESQLAQVFSKFADEVGSVAIGVAARSAQLSLVMGEALLQLHMTSSKQREEAKKIAARLTKDYFHHGYPVSRKEAKEIGLKVAGPLPRIENLMWNAWLDLASDLKVRSPFNPIEVIKANPGAAPLFAPVPNVAIPNGLPPEIMQQLVQQIIGQIVVQGVPGTAFETTHAVVESTRISSKFITEGLLFASRQPDMSFKIAHIATKSGWKASTLAEGARP